MTEMEIVREAIKIIPALGILIWVMLRQEAALKRVTDAYENMAKSTSAVMDRNTEMMGKSGAYLARAADVIDEFVRQKRDEK